VNSVGKFLVAFDQIGRELVSLANQVVLLAAVHDRNTEVWESDFQVGVVVRGVFIDAGLVRV